MKKKMHIDLSTTKKEFMTKIVTNTIKINDKLKLIQTLRYHDDVLISDSQEFSQPSAIGGYTGWYYLVSDKFISLIEKENFFHADDKERKKFETEITKKPHDEMLNPNTKFTNIVNVMNASHEIFDIDGVPYSMPINYGYIDGMMDNQYYDLVKVHKVLEKNKNVTIHKYADYQEPIINGGIRHVAYYNNDDGRRETIYFTACIPRKEYIKAWNLKGAKSSRLHEAIAKLDLLGIEKYRLEN